jgi:hypothetical protein
MGGKAVPPRLMPLKSLAAGAKAAQLLPLLPPLQLLPLIGWSSTSPLELGRPPSSSPSGGKSSSTPWLFAALDFDTLRRQAAANTREKEEEKGHARDTDKGTARRPPAA